MNKDYGFKMFNEIEDSALRVWNRCALMANINETHGEEAAERYASNMTEHERVQMYAMYRYISVKGYREVQAEVNRGAIGNVAH